MKKIYLIAAVIALAAGVATYFFASELKKDTAAEATTVAEEATVLIALEDIPQNTILRAEMFEERKLPKDAVVYGTVCDIEEVVGLMATEKILQGEQLMARKVGIVGNVNASGRLSYKLENGLHAFTINVDARNSLGYALKEGDKVNVYNILTPAAAPVLENVTVISIGDYAANLQQDAGVEITTYSTVTLALTKEQIPKFVEVEENCRLALVSHAESHGLGDDLNSVTMAEVIRPEPATNKGMGVITTAPPETEE